jgi:cytochrome c nitrite reductase small subunit
MMPSTARRFRLKAQLPWLIITGLLGVTIGLGLFTFDYAKGGSYFSDDPQACMNCHVMRDQFEAWQHSTHARVATCNDCHTPHEFPYKWIIKGINGFNHSAAFTLGNFPQPITIKDFNAQIVRHNCMGCHQALVSQIASLHADDPVDCIACHSAVGHRTRD